MTGTTVVCLLRSVVVMTVLAVYLPLGSTSIQARAGRAVMMAQSDEEDDELEEDDDVDWGIDRGRVPLEVDDADVDGGSAGLGFQGADHDEDVDDKEVA